MKNQTIFNPDVYKKGEFYFKKGRVKQIKNNDDSFIVSVMDTDLCQVTLKLDPDNQIIESSCTCELGKAKKQCKHLIAAYLALVNQKQHNDPPLSVVYQKESKHSTAKYHKDNILCAEIKKRSENILDGITYYNQQVLKDIISLLNEYIQLHSESYNAKQIDQLFEIAFKKLFSLNVQYQTDTYNWLKKIYTNRKNHLFNNLAQSIIDLFDSKSQVNFYIEILSHLNVPDIVNDFFPRLFKITRAYPEYKKDIIENLNNYQNSYIYQRIYIEYLVSLQQYKKADEQITLVKKRLNLKSNDGFDDLRLEIAFQLKDEEKSKRLAIEYTKEHMDDANFSAFKKFKKIFGRQWDDISQDIYNELNPYFDHWTYTRFILDIKDHQRALYEVLSHYNEERLDKYKSLLLERYPEIYFYYACQMIKTKANKTNYSFYLHEMQNDMDRLLKEGCPYECILNLILEIELAHVNSTDLHSFFDNYKIKLEERYHV